MLRDPEPGRRNLLIVFSDGRDTASWLPDLAALDLATRADIVVYGVTSTKARNGRDRTCLCDHTPRNVSATGWHRIEVGLTNRKGDVTARRGYDRGGP